MDEVRSVKHCACHLERQSFYAIELDVFDRWLAGDRSPPVDEPGFREWYDLVAGHVTSGRTVARVRVIDEPPTDYQNFELWCGQWNLSYGEALRSMPRSTAERIGLIRPHARPDDWWLLDRSRLMVMPFDVAGNLGSPFIVTDRQAVERALVEWNLAIEHSTADRHDTAGSSG